MTERLIYERDGAGKLTSEAKYELERLNKEVVRREYKESRTDRENFDEAFVNLDPNYVFKRKPAQKLKWLEKVFGALLDNRIKPNPVYDIISHSKFIEGISGSLGESVYSLIEKNLGFFTEKQQRYFASPRFELHKKHAVMTILDSDDEDAGFKVASRPVRDEDKPSWLLRKEVGEREEREKLEEEREAKIEAAREIKRKREEEELREMKKNRTSPTRSRSRSSARSESSSPSRARKKRSDDKEKEGSSHNGATAALTRFGPCTVRPDGKPKIERRIDPADGTMYTLEEFCQEYGGDLENPPQQWKDNSHTSFLYNE